MIRAIERQRPHRQPGTDFERQSGSVMLRAVTVGNGIPHRPMLSDASFGHDGASGSLGFADADADREIGFGYLNNRMLGFSGNRDERAVRLVGALRRCL